MVDCNADELMQSLADEYGLRYLEKSRQYVGLHKGVLLQASREGSAIVIYAASVAVELGEQILNDFAGFSSLRESGVPPKWLRGRMLSDDVDPHGCVLELSPDRLGSITTDQFLAIPEHLAKDFESLGDDDFVLRCEGCGAEDPQQVAVIGRAFRILCDRCFSVLKVTAPLGRLEHAEPVNWMAAGMALLIGSLIFGSVWGWLQQPSLGIDDAKLLLFAPFLGSVFFVRTVSNAAGASSIGLRLATVACILLATFAGNIWGFRSHALAQGVALTWKDAAMLYFQVQIPHNSEAELFYLLGGAAGAWFGLSILKAAGFTKVE